MDAWPFPWAKPTAAAVFAAALAAGFTDAPSNPFRLLTAFTMTCFFAAGGGTIGGKVRVPSPLRWVAMPSCLLEKAWRGLPFFASLKDR